MMHFDRPLTFYDAPFPSDDLRTAAGAIDLSKFPNPSGAALMNEAVALASQATGFAVSGGVFFQTTAPLSATSLPDRAGSVAASADVYLVSVDGASPDVGVKYPVEVAFAADGGPFGAPNLLSLLPVQGIPLRANTAYAAVVTTDVKDATGTPLAASPVVASLTSGAAPAGMPATALSAYTSALAALAKAGLTSDRIAGLAVFTTGDPLAQTRLFRDDILARPAPAFDAPFKQTDLFDDYCVYESTLPLPDYQAGTPPFTNSGGGWAVDGSGKPAVQRNEEARAFVTVPRHAMPDAGYPLSFFIRTGGGGDRPLVDRGTQATNGGPPIVPGSGPALYFARAGFAGVSFDGPLGGLRNTTNDNEDFTIFNIFNALALRDNVRESALELILEVHLATSMSFDASDCPGARSAAGSASVHFDTSHVAIMGHSMGATIAPLAVALEPAFKSVILSGAGGSWIENVMYKQMPLDVKPAIEFLLQYATGQGQELTPFDPALTLFQWALEPADPPVYGRAVTRDGVPRNVLMFQGIVDHYILPDIANATTLSIGLDLAGTELDQSSQEPAGQTPVTSLLPLAGLSAISLPAAQNLALPNAGTSTGVLVQANGDAIEDGHEVVFQTDGPKHQYQCFLASTLSGTPSVPVADNADAGCP
jgi:hypothetical protein